MIRQFAMILLVLICPLRALAVAPLSGADLLRHCTTYAEAPDEVGARICAAYVSGFLDGAEATDPRVAQNVAAEADREETFSERAIRTRIDRRLQRFGPSVYAEFCVGRAVTTAEIVSRVVADAQSLAVDDGVLARGVLDDTLRRHYPCGDAPD